MSAIWLEPALAGAEQELGVLTRGFNALDWAIVLLSLFCVVRGLLRGAVREIFGVAGLLAGVVLAAWDWPRLSLWLESRGLLQGLAAAACAYVLILVAVYALFVVAGRLVCTAARWLGLGLLDRVGGGLLGLLRAGVLAALVVQGLGLLLPQVDWVRTSRLTPPLIEATRVLEPLALEQRHLLHR